MASQNPAQKSKEPEFPIFSHAGTGVYISPVKKGDACSASAEKHVRKKRQLQDMIFSFYLPMTMTMYFCQLQRCFTL